VRRLALSLALIAAGAALFAASARTGDSTKNGGIFRYGTTAASVQIDPQLAYVTTAWWLEYATAAKLLNYPDRRGQGGALLRPELASRYSVSRDGRTWTFVLRRGFRFSDGSPVTARSFAYAIDRVANHHLASPAAPFITDPKGTEILGARDVNEGRARHVRGVTARGYRLKIRLTHPSWVLPTILAMPFFQATSTTLPLEREVLTGYPSAGPYAFTKHLPDRTTKLRRNRYYRGARPHHLAGVDVTWNLQESSFDDRPQYDAGFPPLVSAAEIQAIVRKFGVNKTRFWVMPTNCVGFLPLNSERPLLKDNAPLRKAINWIVDRRRHLHGAAPYSGSPWTHLLPPTFPGSVTARSQQPYAPNADVVKARRLAAGHLRSGKAVIGYLGGGGLSEPELLRDELVRLGFKPENVTFKLIEPWDGGPGKLVMPYDIGVPPAGWCSDYLDPETFLEPLLYFTPARGVVTAELAKVRRLAPDARMRALGRLDARLMRDLAPIVAMRTYNSRYVFSGRVDPRSLVYSGPYSDWSIPALALK
jgi:ABC-type oligopeptide transport system substrate-binding subunit